PLLTILVWCDVSTARGQWLGVGGNRARTSVAARGPRDLSRVRWSATPDPNEQYVYQSTPAVADARVFVNARVIRGAMHVANRLIAYDAVDGARLWSANVAPDILDSWSSPAIDIRNGAVLLASDDHLYSFDQVTGDLLWKYDLTRPVVNASPVVTADLTVAGAPANRALITEYDAIGAAAAMLAINVDPFDAAGNPYNPGDLVWTLPLGRASGATPAYADDHAYVAVGAGEFVRVEVSSPPPDPNNPGCVLADWRTPVTVNGAGDGAGFFGGVSVCDGAVFGATYNFVGGRNSAQLFKIDANTGAETWQTACERTDSIPVPVGSQRWLAGGIEGFGSDWTMQRFTDSGGAGVLQWDSAASGFDPPIGGWAEQPAYARGLLYVGSPVSTDPNAPPPGGMTFEPYQQLLIVDTAVDPNQPGFVVDRFIGAGGSPALAHGRLFSIGADGLFAFDPSPPCAADIDASGLVDLTDLSLLLAHFDAQRGTSGYDANYDLNLDGMIDLFDLSLLLTHFDQACN
ncbi:MAG: hypothetical protein D6744_13375, partial [Planctomycetota bacterium]